MLNPNNRGGMHMLAVVQTGQGLMSLVRHGADPMTRLFAGPTVSVTVDRSRTGQGRVVDLALFDALLSMMPSAGARAAGSVALRSGGRPAS